MILILEISDQGREALRAGSRNKGCIDISEDLRCPQAS